MMTFKNPFALGRALAYAAITLSLAFCAQAQNASFFAKFTGSHQSPTGIIQAPDGNFYGTGGGGAHNKGEVFRVTPAGVITTIYSFCSQPQCTDGELPDSALILGRDGNLYGALSHGGNSTGGGIVFRLTLSGEFTTLYTFCSRSKCSDGAFPFGLVQGTDGNFYGSTEIGGGRGQGTLFQISSGGQFNLLYTFCSQGNCADGGAPVSPPIQDIDGTLYGVTTSGGTGSGGVVYELTPSGTYTVLHDFCYFEKNTCPEGSLPTALVQGADGNFYGTTEYGGDLNANAGTIFEITSNHEFSVLHKFDSTDGARPFSPLTLANGGALYGTTLDGGTGGAGTIFEITPAGGFKSLFSFASPQGRFPSVGQLFPGADGNFYGATQVGPPRTHGTIFKFSNRHAALVETVPVAGQAEKSVIITDNGVEDSSDTLN